MTQEDKQRAMTMLAQRFCDAATELESIEPRLRDYIYNVSTDADGHNAYEVLGALKFLRLLRTYELDIETFRDVIYKYEGIWQQHDGVWHHVEGGLKHPGTTGPQYYRLQPFQVFVLASMFLFKVWINTEAEAGTRELLPTEKVMDGYIEDLRRLCTEFTFYTPRKTAKTQLSAFIQFWYFMSADENAECYCCANASDQSKILFSRSKDLIHQMDPRERRIRFTASQVNWKPGQFRSASLTALSAGGKTKDGLFAQLCSADEYGSASYVNGASDMGKLVSVVESSMGPRREPMTFISTTAGINTTGPFVDKLQGIRRLLEKELDPEAEHTLSEDRQMCLLLEPDEWEQQDEELLLTSKEVRRKVNPMLGIIVQHSFYEDEISKARQNPEKMNEVICKLLNVYKGAKVTKWITGDRIRPMQIPKTIDECVYQEGWKVFVGMDYSHGDDLYALTYLAVNYQHRGPSMAHLMFADMEAWVLEATMNDSPNRALYEQWVKDGWLHVCPGEVFDPTLAINAMASHLFAPDTDGNPDEQRMRLDIHSFGYDPAQSMTSVNTLKAWLQSIFTRRGMAGGDIANALKAMVVPVPQSAMVFNPIIGHLEEIILAPEPWIDFSMNPMWPWQFNNVAIEIGRSDLRRFVKGGPPATHKHDNISALGDAMYLFDLAEGRIEQ